MSSPKASVVVLTFNAGPGFEDLLARLSTQEADFDYEILVVDSGSTDGSVELARRYGAAVHCIPSSEFDHGGTRNLGAALSRGEYVTFVVQDAVPLDGRWLSSMVEALEGEDPAAGVYGRQVPRPDSGDLTRILVNSWPTAALERREQFAGGSESFRVLSPAERRALSTFDNVSSCIRRPVWEEFPFVQTNFGEDLRWGKQVVEAGYKLVYEPRSAVLHSHERSLLYDLRRHYVDQLVLLQLFGLVLVPNVRILLLNVLRSTASLWRRLFDEGKTSRVHPKTLLLAARYAAVSQVGVYLGVKVRGFSGVSPKLRAGLDRFLSRGI